MGEHKPKPIYYVKVTEPQPSGLDEDYLSDEVLREVFGSIGQIGDIYRPVGNSGEFKEFAFVGFYNPKHVENAVRLKGKSSIGRTTVTVEEVKSWMLELYPKK